MTEGPTIVRILGPNWNYRKKGISKMRGKIIKSRDRKMFYGLIALVFVILGVCFWETGSTHVWAAEEPYFYVKQLDISAYRTDYIIDSQMSGKQRTYSKYPMLTEADNVGKVSNYQDWIFAGWFYDEECTQSLNLYETSGTYYAKFVPSDILSIRCQIGADVKNDTSKANLRLVSSIDCNIYRDVGFEVQRGSTQKRYTSNSVYKRINATLENGNDVGYSPQALHDSSQFFFTFSLTNIGNKNFSNPFYLRPFWRTGDGTLVYGQARYACVEDGYLHIVNVPVRLNANMQATTSFKNVYTTNKDGHLSSNPMEGVGNESFTGNYTVTGRPAVFDKQDLIGENAYAFTELDIYSTDNTDGVWGVLPQGTPVIKSLYEGNEDNIISEFTVNKARTDWYYNVAKQNSYTISTVDQLYGLARLVNTQKGEANKTETIGFGFKGTTVCLGADIVINKGTADGNGWTPESDDTVIREWTPIGYTTGLPFRGRFDGQKHTISGVYLVTDQFFGGLFGVVRGDSETSSPTIIDLKLTNSYFENTTKPSLTVKDDESVEARHGNAYMGSVVGRAGKCVLQNVYSDAILVSSARRVGGLVGYVTGDLSNIENATPEEIEYYNSSVGLIMKSCQYDGEIHVLYEIPGKIGVGGLVGYVYQAINSIDTCMFTGEIEVEYRSNTKQQQAEVCVGGLCGQDRDVSYGLSQDTEEDETEGFDLGNQVKGHIMINHSLSAGNVSVTWLMNNNGVEANHKQLNCVNPVIGGIYHSSTSIVKTYSITQVKKDIVTLDENNNEQVLSNVSTTDCYADEILKKEDNEEYGFYEDNYANSMYAINYSFASDMEKLYGSEAAVNLTELSFDSTQDSYWVTKEDSLPIPMGLFGW